MPKIAISYRRADSEAMTGRIFDRLIAHYGKEAIFRDIDDIPPGIDFRVHINQTLLKTHILLAIVGPQWLGMASDGSADRIQEESDPVRVEVETALRRRVPLIPVLIGATKMPSSDLLPPSLKDFAFRNAVKVDTGQDFDYHMDRLIRSMDAILEQAPKSPPSRETKTPTAPRSRARPSARPRRLLLPPPRRHARKIPAVALRQRLPMRPQKTTAPPSPSRSCRLCRQRATGATWCGRQTRRDACCGSGSPARPRSWRWRRWCSAWRAAPAIRVSACSRCRDIPAR